MSKARGLGKACFLETKTFWVWKELQPRVCGYKQALFGSALALGRESQGLAGVGNN